MENFLFKSLLILAIVCSNIFSSNGEIVNHTDTRSEFRKILYQLSKPFALSSINDINISDVCRKDSEFYLTGLQNLDLWAIQMYDATAKTPSGLTNGNIHVTGDLNMCINSVEKSSNGQMKGKYCLAQFYVEPVTENTAIKQIMNQVHSYKAFHASYEDEIASDLYFLPAFNKATWGFCIPSSCTHNDLENFLHHLLKPYNHSTGLEIKLRVRPSHCKTNQKIEFSLYERRIFLWIFIIVWFLLIFFGAIYDNYYNYELCNDIRNEKLGVQILYAYSVRRNWKLLMTEDSTFVDDIPSVHGIRAIFSIGVYLLHKSVTEFFKPLTNRTEAVESTIGPASMFIRVFFNYVGTFAILSGLLTSYYAVKNLKQGRKLNILSMYITRYLKFLPGLLVIFVFIDSDYEFFTNPIQFNTVDHFEKMCRNHFWQRILMVENLYGLNDMCYPMAHQLYTDFQLYLTAPFIILLLWKYPKHTLKLLFGLIVVFSAITAITTYLGHFSMLFTFGRALKDAKSSFDFMYTNPVYWMVFYLCGLGLGYCIRTSESLYLTKDKRILGWIVAVVSFYYSFFAMSEVSMINYSYDRVYSTIFTTMQPITWSFTICWVIFSCQAGYGGFVNKFLTWKKFTIATKLSFAFYICQMGILLKFFIGNAKVPQYFRAASTFGLDEFIFVFIGSILITVFFMIPTIHILFILKEKLLGDKNMQMGEIKSEDCCKRDDVRQKRL